MYATRLRPFFSYYGAKYRLALMYPRPRFGVIVEPFAGSATYSLCYPERHVHLIERNAEIAALWSYLIRVRESEIMALPDAVECVDDLPLAEARTLIGFWLGRGLAEPRRSPGRWMSRYAAGRPMCFWGPQVKTRIASQLHAIRHWNIALGDYSQAERGSSATYFVDPPYQGRPGRRYPEGSASLDYERLGRWASAIPGQVIVCEHADAEWLPFQPLARAQGMRGVRTEGIWLNDDAATRQLSLFEPQPAAAA